MSARVARRAIIDGYARSADLNVNSVISGTYVEASADQVPHATADVERAVRIHRHLALCIAPILHRQERRRQKWRFALAAVGMTRKHPAAVLGPQLLIRRIGIVHEHQSSKALARAQCCHRIAATRPQIIDPNHIEASHRLHFVAQDSYARALCFGDDSCSHGCISPSVAIVMVAEYAHGREAAVWVLREHGAQLPVLCVAARCAVRDEIARVDHHVRGECTHAVERLHEVVVADLWPDVQIADLCQPSSFEHAWQVVDGEISFDDLQPVRLDADRIADDANRGCHDRARSAPHECATIQFTPSSVGGRVAQTDVCGGRFRLEIAKLPVVDAAEQQLRHDRTDQRREHVPLGVPHVSLRTEECVG